MEQEVPFLQFREFVPGMQELIQRAASEVLKRGEYILGQEVSTFEKAFAKYLTCEEGAVVGVGNGYDALVIALKAFGIGKGDEVIIPSNSYMATINAVLQVGAKPVLAEPDQLTYNLTAESVSKHIGPKTKAVIPVHLYGMPCDMNTIMQVADQHRLIVIEDAAQAHGAVCKGEKVGTLGHAAAFSFYPTKNLGAAGDGGALVSKSKQVTAFAKTYRNYGQREKYVGEVVGINSRLDEIQAAILKIKLQYLDTLNKERQRLAGVYQEELSGIGDIVMPTINPDFSHVYHIFSIRSDKRNSLQSHLNKRGIKTAVHYPLPVHLQPAYKHLNYQKGSLPIAESWASSNLSLPLFPGFTIEEQQLVISTVKAFF